MIRLLSVLLVISIFAACGNRSGNDQPAPTGDSTNQAFFSDSLNPDSDTTWQPSYADLLAGSWARVGHREVSLVFREQTVFFPDQQISANYQIRNDSLLVDQPDWQAGGKWRMIGIDTFELESNEEGIAKYYRISQ
ncbi:hypothetical protein HHL16_19375 [Pseudoflavitalea sp. G-6-1-2]|uniref:hypothetical protein n=1 Tax=Pseudoflavitalea sp. G-6-1-2 TaxID=2728841 RepID=UPI00146BC4AD|nr:hypothetical protein [Pseudoflavitalea sp. G-6-1-2]NML23048.1 hypothetical protein [Pseudoflavitalea sp. G-6-1-2]